MKKYIVLSLIVAIFFTSCSVDLDPLSAGSGNTWYSNSSEYRTSVNSLYEKNFWHQDLSTWTDDITSRSSSTEFTNGSLDSETKAVKTLWTNQYKVIARAHAILANKEKAGNSDDVLMLVSEVYFHRAKAYSRLVSRFGDVPYVSEVIDIETAFTMGRTPKAEIIPKIYEDYDKAIAGLPKSYAGFQRITKGAALAYKARFALYMGDWKVAAESAKACMDLKVYSLHEDYGNLFVSSTRTSPELIFVIPRSISLGESFDTRNELSRMRGGYAQNNPSWDLLASYTCTDGLPVDESPLFNPKEPFENRDPRLYETIVPFGSVFLQVDFYSHPDSLTTFDYIKGAKVRNTDSRTVGQHAAYNALLRKKGVDDTWMSLIGDNNIIHMRYADVLLMYAEAKMELGEIDQSLFDAINTVRARAYGVSKGDVGSYPAVTETGQTKLRKIIRMERRSELALEGPRYMDMIRWRHAEVSLKKKGYGIFWPTTKIDRKSWFWPIDPEIDENGLPDFSNIEKLKVTNVLSTRSWDDRQYLWPIPTEDVQINANMEQNYGY